MAHGFPMPRRALPLVMLGVAASLGWAASQADEPIEVFVARETSLARPLLDALGGRRTIDARLQALSPAPSRAPVLPAPVVGALIAPASATASQPDRVASWTDGRMLAAWPTTVGHVLSVHDAQGARLEDIQLPGLGTVQALWTTGDTAHFEYSSFITPPTRYAVRDARQPPRRTGRPTVRFPSTRFAIEPLAARAADGSDVPVVLVRPRGRPAPPVFVYVTAARGSRVPSAFSAPVANWLAMGGAYAFVYARGSGGLGMAWRQAGQAAGKRAAVDDVLAAVRMLEARGLARRSTMIAHAAGHSTVVLTAALQRDPAWARVAWLSYPAGDPGASASEVALEEYGTGAERDALLRDLLPLDAAQVRVLPPTIVTLTLDQPPAVVTQTRRYIDAMRRGGHPRVLLRASTPADADAGSRHLREERVDVYAFLADAVGLAVR